MILLQPVMPGITQIQHPCCLLHEILKKATHARAGYALLTWFPHPQGLHDSHADHSVHGSHAADSQPSAPMVSCHKPL